MKKLILTIVILFSGMLMQAQFRNTTWRMTKDEVKSTETVDVFEEDEELLMFETKLLGFKTLVMYYFEDGVLFSAGYIFDNPHTHENDYIDEFNDLNEILSQKYGESHSDEVKWKMNYTKMIVLAGVGLFHMDMLSSILNLNQTD